MLKLERPSLGNILTILGILGALGAVWAATSADNADVKRRVDTVEKRQIEDRSDVRDNQREIKQDVKETKETVQIILRKIDAMEAAQKSRR